MSVALSGRRRATSSVPAPVDCSPTGDAPSSRSRRPSEGPLHPPPIRVSDLVKADSGRNAVAGVSGTRSNPVPASRVIPALAFTPTDRRPTRPTRSDSNRVIPCHCGTGYALPSQLPPLPLRSRNRHRASRRTREPRAAVERRKGSNSVESLPLRLRRYRLRRVLTRARTIGTRLRPTFASTSRLAYPLRAPRSGL